MYKGKLLAGDFPESLHQEVALLIEPSPLSDGTAIVDMGCHAGSIVVTLASPIEVVSRPARTESLVDLRSESEGIVARQAVHQTDRTRA